MQRLILLLALLLVACPHPTPPPDSGNVVVEAGANDCNLDGEALDQSRRMNLETHFSPPGGCQDAIIAHIQSAKRSIHMQAYAFTSKPIMVALVAAQAAGKDVQVIVDSGEAKQPVNPIATLRAGKVPVWLDAKHLIAHNKVLIYDSDEIFTGSYNFTNAAEKENAENCLIVFNSKIADDYEKNWELHRSHSIAVP